jgi:ankyrin repeat protein
MKNLLGSKFGAALASSRECLGASPLHLCAASGHLDCCSALIHSSGQPSVNARNAFGQTPLMLAAARGGKGAAVVDLLITAGANPSARDADGERERERRERAP